MAPKPLELNVAAATKPRSLRQLTRPISGKDEVDAALEEIEGGSDRSAVIILSSLVEHDLEHAIQVRLERRDKDTMETLIGRDGALSSFYTKIHLAYAMGVYDNDARQELEIIRRIRNVFAHSALSLTLDSPELQSELKKLGGVKISEETDFGKMSESRKNFARQCLAVVEILVGSMEKYNEERETYIAGLEAQLEKLKATLSALSSK